MVHGRRQSHRKTDGGSGADHVTGGLDGRKAISTGNREESVPLGIKVLLLQVVVLAVLAALDDTVLVTERSAELLDHVLGLGLLPGRDGGLELGDENLTVGALLNFVKHFSDDSEGLGDDATGLTAVVAGLTAVDLKVNDCDASKRTGDPKVLVVEGTGVHAKHDIGDLDDVLGLGQEVEKLDGARFLFGLDGEDDSGHLDALKLAGLDGHHAGEGRVSIISTSSSVEVVSNDGGLVRRLVSIPALAVGLLVEMAVHKDVLVDALGALHDVSDERHTVLSLEAVLGDSLDLELVDVVVDVLDGLL
mmetsp:Transcript_41787/g.63821  ORF Transcript_41787/g.63821 Transcript_41787/m.63821 type:complete len:305 (-) Transcript_41787:169-1083(-)